MRYLGIDFGERRTGLAISDDTGRVATPLMTIQRTSDAQAISEIIAVIESEGVQRLVLGEPLRLDGSRGPAAERVSSFARKLGEATGLPITLVDEALTTHEAAARLAERPSSRRDSLDAVAAQIILQEALDSHLAGKSREDPQ